MILFVTLSKISAMYVLEDSLDFASRTRTLEYSHHRFDSSRVLEGTDGRWRVYKDARECIENDGSQRRWRLFL